MTVSSKLTYANCYVTQLYNTLYCVWMCFSLIIGQSPLPNIEVVYLAKHE